MTQIADKPREAPAKTGVRHIGPAHGLEVREDTSNGGAIFSGYAVKWDDVATIPDWLGEFTERFQPGAFAKTIAERGPAGNGQIKFLRHHGFESSTVAARYLKLEEDNVGLRFEAESIDTAVGRDLAAEVRSGVVDTLSVGFDAIREIWDADEEDRTILEARLWEISAVNWPAYPASKVDNVRAFERLPVYMDTLLEEMREGKVLSSNNYDKLVEARDLLDTVIASATPEPDPTEDSLEDEGRQLDIELEIRARELNL